MRLKESPSSDMVSTTRVIPSYWQYCVQHLLVTFIPKPSKFLQETSWTTLLFQCSAIKHHHIFTNSNVNVKITKF